MANFRYPLPNVHSHKATVPPLTANFDGKISFSLTLKPNYSYIFVVNLLSKYIDHMLQKKHFLFPLTSVIIIGCESEREIERLEIGAFYRA